MSDNKKNLIINSFSFLEEALPRNYGTLYPLDQFLAKYPDLRRRSFLGDGELVLDSKRIRESEDWIKSGYADLEVGIISLEELSKLIPELCVWWVSATELLF